MNYIITATIFDQINIATSDPGKEGIVPAAKLVKQMADKSSYNISAGKDTKFTGAELKAKIKADLKLADTIIDVTLKTGDGKIVADEVACEAYGIKFEATNVYVAPVTPVKTV